MTNDGPYGLKPIQNTLADLAAIRTPDADGRAGGGAATLDEIDRLRELLRRVVMDAGVCDNPTTCHCSHAQAWRELRGDA